MKRLKESLAMMFNKFEDAIIGRLNKLSVPWLALETSYGKRSLAHVISVELIDARPGDSTQYIELCLCAAGSDQIHVWVLHIPAPAPAITSVDGYLEEHKIFFPTEVDLEEYRARVANWDGGTVGDHHRIRGYLHMGLNDLFAPDLYARRMRIDPLNVVSDQELVDRVKDEHAIVDVLTERETANPHALIAENYYARYTKRFDQLNAMQDLLNKPVVGNLTELKYLIPLSEFVPVALLSRPGRALVHRDYLFAWSQGSVPVPILNKERNTLFENLSRSYKRTFKDVVAGKSQGYQVLFHGPPGSGKTLFVEALASHWARPLYRVQCAYLGQDPALLTQRLRVLSDRITRWNAIALLDDADVYISKRGESLTQNAIIGVMLEFMERYPGWLFLTTNLVPANLDQAIVSRCLLCLKFQFPDVGTRTQLWVSSCTRNDIKLTKLKADELARSFPKLGGRGILNAVKLALLLSPAEKITPAILQRSAKLG